jgi:hypothetical protein
MENQSPADTLDTAAYLYLREIGEPKENSLRIVVEEAIAGPLEKTSEIKQPPIPMQDARPIISDSSCFSYELVWPSYVSYSVRNESYATVDKEEKFEGRFLRHYSKSKFLDYVSKSTFANNTYLGPLAHWEIVTLNHIIDIVSTHAPQIRRFKNN